QQQKRFGRWTALERDERSDGIAVDAAAEAVHRLRWIREDAPLLDVVERRTQRCLDFFRRPKRNRERVRPHSGSVKRASARAKSLSSVTFIARSLPRTTVTGIPSRS